MPDDTLLFPNAGRLKQFIEAEPDPAVRSLLRLVEGEFSIALADGKTPQGNVDVLYCFERMQSAFRRKDAVASALRGEYGTDDDPDWS